MLVLDYSFPTSHEQDVKDAVEKILDGIHGQGVLRPQDLSHRFPLDLREGLEVTLSAGVGRAPVTIKSRSVVIAYDNRDLQAPDAYTAGACIWLCERTFRPQPRLKAVLLHELVHVLCGLELDAETFENLLFPAPAGATLPDQEDIKTFARKHWKGRWVRAIDAGSKILLTNHWGETVLELPTQISTDMRNTVQNLGLVPIPNA